MRILLISTCSYELSEEEFLRPIAELVDKENLKYDVVRYGDRFDLKGYSKVIICGTALKDHKYLNYINNFKGLITYNGCVLGICAGYQILALLFSNELERIRRIGVYEVKIVKSNPLTRKRAFNSYFLHTYALTRVNDKLEVLALCGDEVAIFKVKNHNFYGVSFHPEVLNTEIIINFLKM